MKYLFSILSRWLSFFFILGTILDGRTGVDQAWMPAFCAAIFWTVANAIERENK